MFPGYPGGPSVPSGPGMLYVPVRSTQHTHTRLLSAEIRATHIRCLAAIRQFKFCEFHCVRFQ